MRDGTEKNTRRGHRLLSRRRTHLKPAPSRLRRKRSAGETLEPTPPAPGRGFVIGPVEGGSDIGFDPPVLDPGATDPDDF